MVGPGGPGGTDAGFVGGDAGGAAALSVVGDQNVDKLAPGRFLLNPIEEGSQVVRQDSGD